MPNYHKADLIIVNGLELEAPQSSKNLKPKDARFGVGNNTVTEEQYVFDASFPKGGKPNPHLWVNTKCDLRKTSS